LSSSATWAGPARRVPTDAEFSDHLRTRDAYHFRRSLYLLSRLENSYHPKDERDFTTGSYTIEHIMPQNARAHEGWLQMLGDVDDEGFEHLLHNLGNLTLTAYNSELSDGTFEEKKARAIGGYDNEYITISSALHDATEWMPTSIEDRASLLTKRALEVWPIPAMDEATRKAYLLERKGDSQRKTVTFRDLFNAGLIREGDVLTSAHPRWGGSATVTADGAILLPNGQEFSSPSPALVRLFALEGSSLNAANGWWYMRLGEDGPRLHDLRTQLQETKAETERERFRLAYWDGYYELCAESQAFVDAFGDPTERMQNSDWWASFGIGLGNCHLENRAGRRDHNADSGIYFPSGEGYDRLYARRAEVESLLSDPGSEMMWSEPDASTKYRALWLRRDFDYDEQDWSEAQAWMRDMLLRLRAIALEVFS